MGMKRQNIKFIKDVEDLSRQYVGMFKTRKIGLSRKLFRDKKKVIGLKPFVKLQLDG
jgi:hypothetical protein